MIRTQMKFSEYIKQLDEYEFSGRIIISYRNRCHVYCGEPDFNNLFVVFDYFVVVFVVVEAKTVYVSLSDEPKDSEIIALESLRLRFEQELKRKEKAKKDLEEYNKMWDEHEKEQWLELITCAVGFLLAIGITWLLSKIG